MSTPEPELRWYQFSLRSLLLFTTFVAVLCSIGVCKQQERHGLGTLHHNFITITNL